MPDRRYRSDRRHRSDSGRRRSRSGRRTGLLDFWQNIMDDTYDFFDDTIDRVRDDDWDDLEDERCTSQPDHELCSEVHIGWLGPSAAWLLDRKWCYIRMEA